MTDNSIPDHVHNYIDRVLAAKDSGQKLPAPIGLSPEEENLATTIIDLYHGSVDDSEPIPFSEDPVAVNLGLVAPPPPVAVDSNAISLALADAALADLEIDLTSYGHSVNQEWLQDLQGGRINELEAHMLRTLAMLIGHEPAELALKDIEPYPVTDLAMLQAHLKEPWRAEIHDTEVQIVSNDHRLGVLMAHVPAATRLDALNIRSAAWELLTGRWIQHSACVVVSPIDNFAAIVIDAIDCCLHHHAPSGQLTYGPPQVSGPLPDTLASYRSRFQITWIPPSPLISTALVGELIAPDATDGISEILTGHFAEPKRQAFAMIRDKLINYPLSAWEAIATIDQDADPNIVDTALEAFISS